MSARKITRADYFLIRTAMETRLRRMWKWRPAKAFLKFINVDTVMSGLYADDVNAYIVEETYLVVYDIVSPWYNSEITLLEEMLVVRLVPGSDFSCVPAFLERVATEAGATLVCAGTALARIDAALASVYHKHGFQTETHLLIKEL
jgi:hypothetical protein